MPKPRRIGLSLEIYLLYKQHAELFAGIQRYADEQGWETVIDDWAEVTLDSATKGHRPYDGVIARVNSLSLELVEAAAKLGVPLINVQAGSPARDQLPGVFPDFEEVGRLRLEHLQSRGFRQFACLSVSGNVPEKQQAAGFIAAARDAGHQVAVLNLPANWGESRSSYQKAMDQISRWMDAWALPMGVGMATDVNARLVVKMCQERGWRIPVDVAIVGGMNEERLCEQPRPSLSSVEVGYDRVGYEAARLLDDMMEAAEQDKSQHRTKPAALDPVKPTHIILPPVGVVVRESTDFYAVDDELVRKAMTYISDKFHTILEVDDVAQAVGVSPKTLQNRFSATLKRTVAQEIRRVRIERAKRELAGSDCSIGDIATRAGFTSRTRLYEVFKREVGVTPSAYRNQRWSEGTSGE